MATVGPQVLRLAVSWSVGDVNWMLRHSLVVKLDGKALGTVQLVGMGEGLEAWRQLMLKHKGKSGNRQAALLRGILNPRAGWEADAREGRSVVESLDRWEKTISLCRTASGVDISDGILAATVLEHSPENYQNILKQAPSNVRASHSAMRGWLREYAETLRRQYGTSGFSSQQTPSTGPVPMDVDQQCQDFTLAQALMPRARQKGRARAKVAKVKVRARRARKVRSRDRRTRMARSRDTADTAKSGGHKRADCRKRLADGKSKDGAAAASADNDGEVQQS